MTKQEEWTWPQPYEILDHTADIGIRVTGTTLEETLARLLIGYAQLIAGGIEPGGAENRDFDLPLSGDRALVAVDLLREAHRLFSTTGAVPRVVNNIDLQPSLARIRLTCGHHDTTRARDGVEIKAVTYHHARLERLADHYVAEILFDI